LVPKYRFPSERDPKGPKLKPPNIAAVVALIASLVLAHSLAAGSSLTLWSPDGYILHWEGWLNRQSNR
jgi:hypothetical protein